MSNRRWQQPSFKHFWIIWTRGSPNKHVGILTTP